MENPSILGQGVTIALIGIGVVFSGLIILFIFMKLFVYLSNVSTAKRNAGGHGLKIKGIGGNEPVTGEIIAAISLAIQRSREEFHDLEQATITFQKITRPYSPWSSKIHGIRKPAR